MERERTRPVNFRLPESLLAKVEARRAQLAQDAPEWLQISRTDAIKALLSEALESGK